MYGAQYYEMNEGFVLTRERSHKRGHGGGASSGRKEAQAAQREGASGGENAVWGIDKTYIYIYDSFSFLLLPD